MKIKYELACVDPMLSYKELQKAIFVAVQNNFELISVFPNQIGFIAEYVEPSRLSAIIDYPFGNSPTVVKHRGIIDAERKGVKTLDIVVNNTYIQNDDWDKFKYDITVCNASIDINRLNVRYVLDVRNFSIENVVYASKIIRDKGGSYIITSNGLYTDDIADSFTIGKIIVDQVGITPIISSKLIRPTDIKIAEENSFPLLRFNNLSCMYKFFGV